MSNDSFGEKETNEVSEFMQKVIVSETFPSEAGSASEQPEDSSIKFSRSVLEVPEVAEVHFVELMVVDILKFAAIIDPVLNDIPYSQKIDSEKVKRNGFISFSILDSLKVERELFEFFKSNSSIIHKIVEATRKKSLEQFLLINLRDALRDKTKRVKRKTNPTLRKRPLVSLDRNPYALMRSDKANKFFVTSLMPNQTRRISEVKVDNLEAQGLIIPANLMAAYVKDDGDKFRGIVGYNSDIGGSLFRFLQEKSALAIKAHFALWARAFIETNANPEKSIQMTISEFCDDLGFQKKKGAHTRENKQQALEILEILTKAELIVLWTDPQGKTHRTKGNIWKRGLSDEILDSHSLTELGSNKKPEKGWNPNTFSFSPGEFFANVDWSKFNNFVGLFGQGLLKLGTDNKDKAAVLIGGYIAFLARIENYERSRPLNLTTLIDNTGDLLTKYIGRRDAAKLETIIENALDRLIEVKFLKGFEWVYSANQQPSDYPTKVKMSELISRGIKLTFPDELVSLGQEHKKIQATHRRKASAKKATGKK